ncbi:hypothetical protein V6255_01205 [Psychromonas arctica]|uniref:Uncharacterized protein n=1 Tax=Psychromonas arctica TaxID=168275 RepID=A0ABU9H795_9GAMM
MSSLKQLNHSINLTRLEGKDSARQCELKLNLLLHTVRKKTQKHPFGVTIGVTIATALLARYRTKIRSLYPIASLGLNYFNQHRSSNNTVPKSNE